MKAEKPSQHIVEVLIEFCVDHISRFCYWPLSFIYEDAESGKVVFETNDPTLVLSEQQIASVYEQARVKAFENAKVLWDKLADIPVDSDQQILEPFNHFDAGTDVHEIWAWFEATFYCVRVADLMGISDEKEVA